MTESAAHGRRRALAWASTQQWAIEPQSLQQMIEIASREHVPDFEAVAARQGQLLARGLDATLRDGVAVIDLVGPIFRYATLFSRISGASSIEQAALELQAAIDGPDVRAIVLNIDSPGGALTGISDFAKLVRSSPKPVVAFVGGDAASAAFWIASASAWIVVSDTAMLGSVGIVSQIRVDKDDKLIEIVSSQSPNKRPDLTTDAGRAVVRSVVDALADVFIGSVAKYRGVKPADVLTKFGAGSVLVGRSAVQAGMADQVSTFEQVMKSFARGGLGPAHDLVLRAKANANSQLSSADNLRELALGEPMSTAANAAPDQADTGAAASLWDKAAKHVNNTNPRRP